MRKGNSDSRIEVTRLGKDEVNLVEHPFASLSNTPEAQVIENEWETKHPVTGQKITAKWRVEGSTHLGLPCATDERVYLVLMELTREAGFAQRVQFSLYDVLKRLDWSHCARNYESLRDSLRRLNSVTITSENALWNPEAQAFVDVGFHLIDEYRIVASKPGRKSTTEPPSEAYLSHVTWGREIHDSFRHGQIRSIDLGFALSLKGAIALRLYRYLDKKARDGKSTFEIELKRLCEMHLGMASATYTSTLKTRLKPAHDELQTRGFLSETTFEPMKSKNGEKVCYTFPPSWPLKATTAADVAAQALGAVAAEAEIAAGAKPKSRRSRKPKPVATQQQLDSQISGVAQEGQAGEPADAAVLQRLMDLKVSPEVARQLAASTSPDELRLQLDCLGDREPRDPAATLVAAVREAWQVPAKYLERVEAQERARKARTDQETEKARAARDGASRAIKRASLAEVADRLDAEWEKLDPESRERIDHEASARLGVLGQPGRAPAALQAMRRTLIREAQENEVKPRSDSLER